MDEISGSTDSLISLGMAMSQSRLQGEMSVRVLKKGLDAQAQAALSLIQAVQTVPVPTGSASPNSRVIDLQV